MEKILEIKNLFVESREDKKKILENISFDIAEKTIHILIGPNGSGKSSLAYALMGIPRFKVVSGKIIFRNKDITKLSADKRAKMGLTLAFQEPAYFEGITVENFLRAGNKNITLFDIKKILSLVGLKPEKFLNRDINHGLSSGERKRIEFASVIAMKPKLMILDEPDSGLDIIIYREFYNILENIKKETNASILLITHREELGSITDRSTFINQGKAVCSGNFRKVMRKYCQFSGRKKICQKINCQKNS
jgi:Fe-S cluster assembly ATP-binding protein